MRSSTTSPVRKRTAALRVYVLSIALLSVPAIAQQAPPAPPAPAQAKEPDTLPPLPADAHVAQSMQLGGNALAYTATVGTIPVYGADGKKIGEVVFTSYTMDDGDRPVTFALNGGPGASSVYLTPPRTWSGRRS